MPLSETLIKLNGLVLSEVIVGEADKLLTVLTSEGKITVRAYGARSHRKGFLTTMRVLSYSTMQIAVKSNGMMRVKEADLIDGFMSLYTRLEGITLAQYAVSVTNELTAEDMPDDGMLSLTLNTLYALNNTIAPDDRIKSAFELRAMSQCGYLPDLNVCGKCGCELDASRAPFVCDATDGHLLCSECSKGINPTPDEGSPKNICFASYAAYSAMRHIVSCDIKRLFAFRLSEEAQKELSEAAELYLITHLGHRPKALEFYDTITGKL